VVERLPSKHKSLSSTPVLYTHTQKTWLFLFQEDIFLTFTPHRADKWILTSYL
jgi:hypothetical protein